MAKRPAKTKRKAKRKLKPESSLVLGVRRIPWNELTLEEQRNLEALAREEERWRRRNRSLVDHATAGKILDRAAALEKWGSRPKPAPVAPIAEKEKSKSKAKSKKHKGGRPQVYPHAPIRRIAESLMRKRKHKPNSLARLVKDVEDACDNASPCIDYPALTQLKAILRPLFQKHQRAPR